MEVGSLGHDDAKEELSENVARSVAYYTAKYGVAPTLCFVNPKMLKQAELMGSVQARSTVLSSRAGKASQPGVGRKAPRRKKMDVQS